MLRSLAALLLVALCALPARAQSTISATVVGVPALLSSPYVADLKGDYDAQRFMMLVSVAGADPVTAAFRLRLRRNGRVLLDVTSQPVTFSPGTTSYRTFGDEPSIEFGISADKVIERFPAAERAAILQSGALPEGSYTVDIEPIPAGNAFATPTSTPFEVQWPDPPQLTAPVRGEEVTTMPVFAWTPVVMQAGAAMLSYRLRIVEMLPGQNPVRALASNRPILDETLVGQTTFPYTPDQLPLERGKRYAWSVIASADARMPLRNGGASEAETFVYLPAEAPPPDVTPPADETPILADIPGGGGTGAGVTVITPPSYTTPFTVTLPEVRVSGRVRLGLQGGRSVPLADAPVRVSGVVNGQFQPLVIATTDAQGQFTISLADLGVAGAALYGARPTQVELMAMAPPGLDGRIRAERSPLTALSQSGTTDAGVVTLTVPTFRVAVTATDARSQAALATATVTPLRTERHLRELPVLALEGEAAGAKRFATPDGTTALVPTAAPAPGRTGPMVLLSPHVAPAWVLVRAPGYYDQIVPVGSASGDVTLSVALTPSGVTFAGRLVRADDGAPLADQRVTVQAGQAQYETRSDADGRFEVSGVERAGGLTRLTVLRDHRPVYIEDVRLTSSDVTVTRDPLRITTDPIVVVSEVENEDGERLSGAAVIVSAPSEQLSMTDDDGRFTLALSPGTYTITAQKTGYEDQTFELTVTPDGEGDFVPSSGQRTVRRALRLAQRLSTLKARGAAEGLEVLGTPDERLLHYGTTDPLVMRVQKIVLKGAIRKILIRVRTEATRRPSRPTPPGQTPTTPLSNAPVAIKLHGLNGRQYLTGRTNRNGELDLSPVVGRRVVIVAESFRDGAVVYEKDSVVVVVSGSTRAPYTFTLEPRTTNATLTGRVIVLRGPREWVPIADATVTVDIASGGRTMGGGVAQPAFSRRVTTDSNGRYSVEGLPPGRDAVVRVDKTGLASDEQTVSTSTVGGRGASLRADFTLAPPPPPPRRMRITQLNGYPVEITAMQEESNGVRVSGQFTAVPNSVFTLAPGTTLSFQNALVSRDGNEGRATVNGNLRLQEASLSLQVFGVPIILRNPSLRADSPTSSTLTGSELEVDLNTAFPSQKGWATTSQAVKLEVPGAGVLTSSGQLAGVTALRVTSAFKLTAQGIPMDVNTTSTLTANGLTLAGVLSPAGFPNGATLPVTSLSISKNGDLGAATLGAAPTLTLDQWTLAPTKARLSNGAIALDGTIRMPMNGSTTFSSTFKDLEVTQDGLHGGKFTLAGNRLGLFDQVAFTMPAPATFGFGQDEGEDGKTVYELGGPGSITLGQNAYFSVNLPVKEFKVLSTGEFEGTANVGFKASFAGVAKYELKNLTYGNTVGNGGTLGLKLDGELNVDIPKATATVGAITFMPGNRIHVDEVQVKADLKNMASIDVTLSFLNGTTDELPESCGDVAEGTGNATGFCGAGEFEIKKMTEFAANIHYLTRGGSATFGGSLVVGTPDVPLGPTGLVLSKPGMGFSYNMGNSNFLVSVQGDVTIGSSEAGTGLKPAKLTVESGPVFTGTADIYVANSQYGNAKLSLDMDKKLFMANLSLTGKDLFPATTLKGDAAIALSAGETAYWFIGAQVSANAANLLDATATLALGYGYPVSANPSNLIYTNLIPANYKSDGKVNGLHFSASTFMGVDPVTRGHRVPCIDWLFFNTCAWAYTEAAVSLDKSFVKKDFNIAMSTGWRAAFSAGVGKISKRLNFAIKAEGSLSGAYNETYGWMLNGNIYGEAEGGFDWNTVACNDWRLLTPAFKICAYGGATFGWRQYNTPLLVMDVYRIKK